MLATPVLFLIFNRPDTTKIVFEQIRLAKPIKLYIAADGARSGKEDEIINCKITRETVLNGIDWPCEVHTLFREHNLGCGSAPEQAITWFFEQVEEGIILEDDCVPNQSFFSFCEYLLNFYKNNNQVMHISGSNFQSNRLRENASYYFSAYSHGWGWASWSKSWQKHDFRLHNFNGKALFTILKEYRLKNDEIKYWSDILTGISQDSNPSAWDYQWSYSIWKNGGVSIIPNVNLVKNIGFDHRATHTSNHDFLSIETELLEKMKHPSSIQINHDADRYTFEKYYQPSSSMLTKIFNKLRKTIN